jgi:hypothetical protein
MRGVMRQEEEDSGRVVVDEMRNGSNGMPTALSESYLACLPISATTRRDQLLSG